MAREFEDPHCVVLSMSPWTDHITSVGCKCPCYQVGEAVEHSLEEPTLWNWVAHVHIPANLMLLPQLLTILFDPFTKLMCASLPPLKMEIIISTKCMFGELNGLIHEALRTKSYIQTGCFCFS